MYPEVEIKESFGKECDHDIAATNVVETNELDSVNADCDTANNIITGNNNIADDEKYPEVEIRVFSNFSGQFRQLL